MPAPPHRREGTAGVRNMARFKCHRSHSLSSLFWLCASSGPAFHIEFRGTGGRCGTRHNSAATGSAPATFFRPARFCAMLDVSSDDGLAVIYAEYAEDDCDDRDAPPATPTTLTGAECFSRFDYFPDSLWDPPGGNSWVYMDSLRANFLRDMIYHCPQDISGRRSNSKDGWPRECWCRGSGPPIEQNYSSRCQPPLVHAH